MKPLGNRITQGEWKEFEKPTGNGSFLSVLSYSNQNIGESICNITTRNDSRAFNNSEFITLVGNLAQKYPNVEEWESILKPHYETKI